MAEESIGSRLRAALGLRRWNQSDLVRETGLDKNTVSAIVNDRQRPNPGTLGRIEQALGLTPGTLAGSGEEFRVGDSRLGGPETLAVDLDPVSDTQLMSELGYRVERLRREVAGLQQQVEQLTPLAWRERARAEQRRDYLSGVIDGDEDQWVRDELAQLVAMDHWTEADELRFRSLNEMVDALIWALEHDMELVPADEIPTPHPIFRSRVNDDVEHDRPQRAARRPGSPSSKARPDLQATAGEEDQRLTDEDDIP